MNTSIENLKRMLRLDQLAPDDASNLGTLVTTKAYKKNQVIADGESRYLVTRGIVKGVMITSDGNSVFKRFYHSNQSFGNLFCSRLREHLIIASDDATICRIRGCDVLKYFQGRMILSSYHAQMEEYTQCAEEYYLNLMAKDVRARLIHFLERLIEDYAQDGLSSQVTLECPLSIEEIGQSIFATRQSVSFYLSELQKIGWITKHKSTFQFATRTFEQFKFHAVIE
jgi:CRP-like cAMP-binding protein